MKRFLFRDFYSVRFNYLNQDFKTVECLDEFFSVAITKVSFPFTEFASGPCSITRTEILLSTYLRDLTCNLLLSLPLQPGSVPTREWLRRWSMTGSMSARFGWSMSARVVEAVVIFSFLSISLRAPRYCNRETPPEARTRRTRRE